MIVDFLGRAKIYWLYGSFKSNEGEVDPYLFLEEQDNPNTAQERAQYYQSIGYFDVHIREMYKDLNPYDKPPHREDDIGLTIIDSVSDGITST